MTVTVSLVLKRIMLFSFIIAGLYFGKEFFIPLAISAVLATLFLPLCKSMERKKIPRGIAALICLILLLLFTAAVGILLGWQIAAIRNDFDLIRQKVMEIISNAQEYLSYYFGITAEKQWQLLKGQQTSFASIIPAILGSTVTGITGFILIFAYFFMFLYYHVHLNTFVLNLSNSQQRNELAHVIHSAATVSQKYLLGLAKIIIFLWIMYSIGFSLLGLKNAIFFAILCGLLEIVPYIGNITGTAITLLAATTQGASVPVLLGITATYGIVQFIQGWILEPLIVGPQVKINPLFTIISLVIGEMLWGIAGVVLAIPITAILKIFCDHIEALKPYGFLIGSVETEKAKLGFVKRLVQRFRKKRKH